MLVDRTLDIADAVTSTKEGATHAPSAATSHGMNIIACSLGRRRQECISQAHVHVLQMSAKAQTIALVQQTGSDNTASSHKSQEIKH